MADFATHVCCTCWLLHPPAKSWHMQRLTMNATTYFTAHPWWMGGKLDLHKYLFFVHATFPYTPIHFVESVRNHCYPYMRVEETTCIVHNWMLRADVTTKHAHNRKSTMHDVPITAACKLPSHSQSTVSYRLDEVNRSIFKAYLLYLTPRMPCLWLILTWLQSSKKIIKEKQMWYVILKGGLHVTFGHFYFVT